MYVVKFFRRQMPPTTLGQVAIEKTPSYFVTKEAPARLLRAVGNGVKLIVVLRNPVTRALSGKCLCVVIDAGG